MPSTTRLFGQLAVGDLFEVKQEQYRKIPPITIPDVGERNAAKESTQAWVYFSPETVVQHYGHVNLAVDKVRAGKQQTDKQ